MDCRYQDALGIPNEGVHSYRFLGVAIVDVMMTILVAALLSYFFRFPFVVTLVAFFMLGVILHRLFCVRTTIDRLFFS